MAEAIVTSCKECVKCVGPPLKKHLFDFAKNVDDFLKKRSELKAKKASYDQRLAIATRKKELPTKDVKLWIQEYKAIITECELPEYDEDELKRKRRRRRYTIKRFKLSRKLVKRTKIMMELINRYSGFHSLFLEDLDCKNADILENFEKTKCKLEALRKTYDAELSTAHRSLLKPSPEVELWIKDYEQKRRQCDDLENNLKNYNNIRRSIDFGKVEHKKIEMMELIHRYKQITPLFVEDQDAAIAEEYAKTKQEFDHMILSYEQEKLKAAGNRKTSTRLVRTWFDECAELQKKYGGGITEIQGGESSHRQEERISQMKEMENLITRYHQFNGFSNMFVHQRLKTVEKRSTDYKPLNSMEKNKETVYIALKDEMVIRLFGIGGIGKTTLMQQINNEMLNGSDFKLVIWVTVSTTFADIKDIQHQIYDRLKWQWLDRENNNVRAVKISEYLKNNVDGSTLFIFDDVWKMLDLKGIGIPRGTYGNDGRKCCKIILTTRDRNVKVIHEMLPKDIEMKGLDEAESWILFKTNASIEDEDNVDDRIKEIAEQICRKCAGLPLVITVIAKMLNREKEELTWSETLSFLNKGDPSLGIPVLLDDVYITLKLSYDRLGREDLKIGFLLCSLFPEDCEIAVSDLFYYGIGAGEIAKSCQRLDACRSIFIHLKNKGLLQDVEDDDSTARMHDVIRDVAHFIAKKEFGGFFCNAELTKWIFSVQNFSLGMENVLSLDLRQTHIRSHADDKKIFIKKLKELRVLMFDKFYREIPVNIEEYFILYKLSVLCLQGSYIIELDKNFSIELCNLRVIDFSWTAINVIRPKAFSNLNNKLEVLCMLGSFRKWRASDEEDGEYASFAELAELKKLYTLQVDIDDWDIFSHKYRPDLVFSSVECFSINTFNDFSIWNSKSIGLSQRPVKNGANWIKDLLKKTKYLEIDEEEEYLQNDNDDTEVDVVLTYDIIVNTICNLEQLFLARVATCKCAIQYSSNTEGNDTNSKPILPKAKQLLINDLMEMENVFVSTLTPTVIPKGSFEKLQRIVISYCPRLKFIFPWNVAATCLVQLQSLRIEDCDQLEVIVEKEDNRNYNKGEHVWFPELREMELFDLPKLEYVPSGRDEKLENLKQQLLLRENSAPKLKSIRWDKLKFKDLGKKKKEFEAMIETYARERKSAEKDRKIPSV